MEMDASASNKAQASKDINLSSFFLHIHNRHLRTMNANHNNTVIKFTKLPEYDFDSQVLWPRKSSYVLKPHLRRIVTLNDEDEFISTTSRSLRSELVTPHKLMSSTYSKRKIVTISEEDDKQINPLSSNRRLVSGKSQTSGGSDIKLSPKSTSRSNVPSRYLNKLDTKLSAKNIALSSSKVNNDPKNIRRPRTPVSRTQTQSREKVLAQENSKLLALEKEKPQVNRKSYSPNRNINNLSKHNTQPNISIHAIKSDLSASSRRGYNSNSTIPSKQQAPLTRIRNPQIIKVPIDPDGKKSVETRITQSFKIQPIANRSLQIDGVTVLDRDIFAKEKSVGTELEPVKVDVNTETDRVLIQKRSVNVQTVNFLKSHFDNLDIPNVTLIKDKDESKEDIVTMCKDLLTDLKESALEITPCKEENYKSKEDAVKPCIEFLPDLKIPDMEITPLKKMNDQSKEVVVKQCNNPIPDLQVPASRMTPHKESNKLNKLGMSKSQSYIIGHGTVTYTTKQKIDFHVVSNKNEVASNTLSSPLAYPMNVVSIFKKEVNKNKEISENLSEETQKKKSEENSDNSRQSLNCSYAADRNKLVKPSELISTIRLDKGLLQSNYICEQFQRELNFIDSFFESLQYLENCSLSNKSFTDTSVENWVSKSGFDVNVISPEYDSLFSKFENGTNIDDTETMASKSLCLLNLLIRDEQRRAKNLLFVLKMREDALKDFTKSQIIWLENKKKHDNIDIPTLKKKQRGALLKLQHECGEMQRMRKALLALSEKRKVALMKTKKNIELKLKNNVSVEQILLGKKKLKRNSISDRPTVPLKCFDLSSSGCDESTTSRAKSEPALLVLNAEIQPADVTIKSVEKSIQTGDSLLSPNQVDETTDTAAELFITVDGGYLNILFNNFSLPEIFSYGKNYEVNEEAIRSIVKSANSHNAASESDVIDKFIDQIKHRDQDRSTTPSTARSLVEEFDQYYKGLAEEDLSSLESPERPQSKETSVGCIVSSVEVATDTKVRVEDTGTLSDISAMESEPKNPVEQVSPNEISVITTSNVISTNNADMQTLNNKGVTVATQAGPLPVSASAAAGLDENAGPDIPVFIPTSPSTSTNSNSSIPTYMDPHLVSLVSPVHNEAEELRRQQLAIEREIKALEQQQCQLLVVREIPDKPPPPYIPPAEARAPKATRMFTADESVEEKVEKNLTDLENEPTDPFDMFLLDFCQESADKHKKEPGDKPWDACNLMPQKPSLSQKNLVQITAAELKDVLKGVSQPAAVSNVGARRSDHIDDILFAEWRRYEPKWTALHADEAAVKNQVFEGIFQSILAKTVDEYKKIIQRDCQVTDSE